MVFVGFNSQSERPFFFFLGRSTTFPDDDSPFLCRCAILFGHFGIISDSLGPQLSFDPTLVWFGSKLGKASTSKQGTPGLSVLFMFCLFCIFVNIFKTQSFITYLLMLPGIPRFRLKQTWDELEQIRGN